MDDLHGNAGDETVVTGTPPKPSCQAHSRNQKHATAVGVEKKSSMRRAHLQDAGARTFRRIRSSCRAHQPPVPCSCSPGTERGLHIALQYYTCSSCSSLCTPRRHLAESKELNRIRKKGEGGGVRSAAGAVGAAHRLSRTSSDREAQGLLHNSQAELKHTDL